MAEDDSSDFIEPASDEASFVTENMEFTSDYDPTLNNESLLGSVTSSICAHRHEGGRRYHAYKEGKYPFPNDDLERTREGVRNLLFKDLVDGRLHLAPIGDHPQKIADLGTGFGEWAIEMGDKYPSAAVLGLDISPIQPQEVPPNVRFVVDDIELEQWVHEVDYDYIHLRMTAPFLVEPDRVTEGIFRCVRLHGEVPPRVPTTYLVDINLKPGGWIEFQDLVPRVCCNDDTLPADYPITRFFALLTRFLRDKKGWDVCYTEDAPGKLEAMGFVNVQRKICHVPIGFWSKDKNRKHHAGYYREVISELLNALLAKPLAEGAPPDLTREQVEELFAEVRKALSGHTVHAYVQLHFVWAQKPPATL